MNLARNGRGHSPHSDVTGAGADTPRPTRQLSFLPPVIENTGDWNGFISAAYRTFQDDFIVNPPTFMGRRVVVDKKMLDGRFLEGFWHVVQCDKRGNGERQPDFRRAERVSWIRPLICNYRADGVIYRSCLQGRREVRHYLVVPSKNYVVILGEKKRAIFLVTAFCMNQSFMQRAIFRQHPAREAGGGTVEMAAPAAAAR